MLTLIRIALLVVIILSTAHLVALAQVAQSPEVEKAQVLFKQALDHAQRGNYKAAIEDFSHAIKLNERYAEAYYHRGLVLLKAPWTALSPTQDFEQTLRLNPGSVDAYLQLGIYKHDISYFDRAIAINPGLPEAYYYRGQIRARDAIKYLDELRDKGTVIVSDEFLAKRFKVPPGSSPEQALALVSNLVRLSIDDYTHAISLKSDDVTSYFARGLAYMRLKEYESAAGDFASVIRLDAKNVDGYMNRGIALGQLKNFKAAVDDFTQVITLDPRNPEAYEKRGVSRLETGDKSGAIDDYIQVIRLGRTNDEGDEAYLQKLADNPKIADVYYELGLKYRYGRLRSINDKAIENFSRALELNPNLARAYYDRGLSRFEERQTGPAIEDFNTAIRMIPGDPDLYFSRAQARFEAKDNAGAVADFTEALRLNTEITDTFFQRGLAYSAARDWENAIADFTATIKLDPLAPDAYYRRAIAYDLSGDEAKAVADYLNFVERSAPKQDGEIVVITGDTGTVAINYYRGLAHLYFALREGRRESILASSRRDEKGESCLRAIAEFTQVVRSRPNLAEAYYQRARAHWKYSERVFDDARKQQQILAESDFGRALTLRPSFAQAYFDRGLIYRDSLRIEKGIADLSRAIELKPRWARAYYERGQAFAELYEGAKPELVLADNTQAINLDPNYRDAYKSRARVRGAGGTAGMLADLAEVIRLSPDDLREYRWRGELRLRLKDYSGAIEDFTRAIEIHPGVPGGIDHDAGRTYLSRGRARYQLGDGQGAYEDYQSYMLVDRCPSCHSGSSSVANASKAETFYRKGLNLSSRGDKQGARESLEQAAKLYHTVGDIQKYQSAKYQISKL